MKFEDVDMLQRGTKVLITKPERWEGKYGTIQDINGCGNDIYYLVKHNGEGGIHWFSYKNLELYKIKVIFT